MLKDHLRPAAERAGISSKFGWHAFRHSFASIIGETEQVKVVQELPRHSTPRMTLHYMKGNSDAPRSALSNVSGIFAVPGKTG